MSKIHYHLLKPRRITRSSASGGAWYYINERSVDVMVQQRGVGTFSARLTKRQLQQALAAMEKCK